MEDVLLLQELCPWVSHSTPISKTKYVFCELVTNTLDKIHTMWEGSQDTSQSQ